MKLDNTDFAHTYVKRNLDGCGPNEQYIIFEALIRRKDNANPVFTNAHGDSLLLRAWYVDTLSKFEKYLPEMKYLCKITGARLYMTLDTKSTDKFSVAFAKEANEVVLNMLRKNQVSAKNVIKMPLSVLASDCSSVHAKKKILIDIDETQQDRCDNVLNSLINVIPEGVSFNMIKSANGAHLIIDRTGLNSVEFCENVESLLEVYDFTVKKNAMTVVYFNKEEIIHETN